MRLSKIFNKHDYHFEEKKTFPWLETAAAFTASLSFFCIGVLRSYTSPAILSIQRDTIFNRTLSSNDVSWIASSPPLAAIVGAVLSGPLLQFMGRQKTLVAQFLPCILGWLFIGFSTNYTMIIMGRALTGLASGLSKATAQLYISEIARTRVRGILGYLPGMLLSLGILTGLGVGTSLYWRYSALALAAFPALALIMSMPLPESPTFLLMRKQESEAFDNLKLIRGKGRDAQVRQELDEIKENLVLVKEAHAKLKWKDVLFQQEVYWPLSLTISLMVFQQFTGINAIINYLENILEEAEAKSNGIKPYFSPEQSAMLVGLVQFLAFFISLPLIDWVGRRALLLTSSVLMGFSHIFLGSYFYACARNDTNYVNFTAAWLPLTSLCVYVASYSIGFASIPHLVASEVFPSHLRSYLCSITSFVNLICTFVIVRYFPLLQEALYPGYVFFFFALVCAVSCIIVVLAMPETRGKSLVQIQTLFHDSLSSPYLNETLDPFNNASFDERNNSSFGSSENNDMMRSRVFPRESFH